MNCACSQSRVDSPVKKGEESSEEREPLLLSLEPSRKEKPESRVEFTFQSIGNIKSQPENCMDWDPRDMYQRQEAISNSEKKISLESPPYVFINREKQHVISLN